jgi:hypothetical protein
VPQPATRDRPRGDASMQVAEVRGEMETLHAAPVACRGSRVASVGPPGGGAGRSQPLGVTKFSHVDASFP